MFLIAETTKSKVFLSGEKVYKFRKNSKKKSFDNEILVYQEVQKLNLENIIKFNNIDRDILMIEMDYYPYDLESYIAGRYHSSISFNIKQKFKLIYTIVHIIGIFRLNNIVHGDFKAKNILFDSNLNPIITDFDLGKSGTLDNDLHKMKILIYQILYNVEYIPKLYNNINKLMDKNMKKDYNEIYKLLEDNNLCNLLILLSKLF